MEEKLLRDYARLIACQGGHVVKGDIVWINAGLDQPDFVTLVVEECYKAGAKSVTVYWHHDPVAKQQYKYETVGELAKVSPISDCACTWLTPAISISTGSSTVMMLTSSVFIFCKIE